MVSPADVPTPPSPDTPAAPGTGMPAAPINSAPELSDSVIDALPDQVLADRPMEDAQANLPPRFDLVRVDPAGSAVIAGWAGANAEVTLTLDGEPLEVVAADPGGQFVALLALAPSDLPRVLTLESVLPGGAALRGEESVIIAPFAGDALAAVQPEVERRPPEPPPTTRADPPRLGEATSTAPEIDGGAVDAAPGGAPVAGLSQAAEDAPPAPGTAPPATGEGAQDPSAPDPVAEAQSMPLIAGADGAPDGGGPDGDLSDPAGTIPPTGTTALPSPPAPVTGAAPRDPAPDTAPQGQAAAPAIATPEAPAILLAGRDGIRILQSPGAPPEALTELQLDAISYDPSGAVTLAGRGAEASSVRATLNNQPINLGEIGPGGQWSLDLPDVDPGTYTLRLEEMAADGTVTDAIETPFLREDPARIRANPMLVEPGASVITVQRGFTLWGIAEANFGEGVLYVQIFDRNRDEIRDPDLIFPGQIFALPDLPRGGETVAGE